MEKRQSLQQMVLGKLDNNMQKNETRPLSYTIHKNKFKMDKRSKCETGTIKILGENIGSNLFDIGYSNFLLDMSPEAREIRAKRNCWDFIKIKKNFYTVKKQSTELKGNLQNGRRCLQRTYLIKG